MAVGFRLDVQEANLVKDREQRRARQEAYRRELNSQVADSEARRELEAQQVKELEERHELKSVRIMAIPTGSKLGYVVKRLRARGAFFVVQPRTLKPRIICALVPEVHRVATLFDNHIFFSSNYIVLFFPLLLYLISVVCAPNSSSLQHRR